jgi:hypothetical protein
MPEVLEPRGPETEPDGRADTRIRGRIGGTILVLAGGFVIAESLRYSFGTLARMGPGMLPAALGSILIALGIIVFLAAEAEKPAEQVPVAARPAVSVLAAVLAFALLAETAGLVIATTALVFIAGIADPHHGLRTLMALSACLAVFVWLVFVEALGIPFRLFVWPF